MISGIVHRDEACIRLKIKGPSGRAKTVSAVVDTGFTAALTLPPATIGDLGLVWRTLDRGMLADGSECLFDVYEAEMIWDGKVRRVLVSEADAQPLVGMGLLRGFELRIQVRARGKVTIKKLTSK